MKKSEIGTILALAVGIGGPIIGFKLHKKAKKLNEETEKSMIEANKQIHRSYAEVVEKAIAVDDIKPDVETADKLERMFGVAYVKDET